MADERATRRCRTLYAALVRLYPETFRRRFAESMEQTFHDLCRERGETGKSLFPFALGLFLETSVGILSERTATPMLPRRKLVRLVLVTAFILSVPLVAMQFSDEVSWTVLDFVIGGALLFGTGLGFELVAMKAGSNAYRAAAGLAFATGLLLVWMNLAVGLIGSEDNPGNVLYLGVLIVAILGASIARLRPRGMARALYATALAQALVSVVALIIWRPMVSDGEGGVVGVLFLNAIFVVLFVGSGVLFGIARAAESKSGG